MFLIATINTINGDSIKRENENGGQGSHAQLFSVSLLTQDPSQHVFTSIVQKIKSSSTFEKVLFVNCASSGQGSNWQNLSGSLDTHDPSEHS